MSRTLPALDSLSYSALYEIPIFTDWGEGWTETWDHYDPPHEAVRFDDEQGIWLDDDGNECDGSGEGPMMSFRYSLPHFDGDYQGATQKLIDACLPLCLVDYEGEAFLALTGGGMDLSWEICAAYIVLGYFPPIRFCQDLPRFAGGPRIPEILPACDAAMKSVILDCYEGIKKVTELQSEQ